MRLTTLCLDWDACWYDPAAAVGIGVPKSLELRKADQNGLWKLLDMNPEPSARSVPSLLSKSGVSLSEGDSRHYFLG